MLNRRKVMEGLLTEIGLVVFFIVGLFAINFIMIR